MGFITAFHQRSGSPVTAKRPKKNGILTTASAKSKKKRKR